MQRLIAIYRSSSRIPALLRLMAGGMAAAILMSGESQAQGAEDVAAFRDAATLVASGDWQGAELAMGATSPVARAVFDWMRLRDGPTPDGAAPDPRDPDPVFGDYLRFIQGYPHWPGLDRLRAQGERSIAQGTPADQVLAYFADQIPQTGQGAAALAQAHMAQGRPDVARQVVETAWLTLGLTEQGQAALVGPWSDVLAPLHKARAEEMLWRWRANDTIRLFPYLSAEMKALAEARIALMRDAPDQAEKLAAVPPALAQDAGLAVDLFNRLADDGEYTQAAALLAGRSASAEMLGQPFRWASWRANLARWALREGQVDLAYDLAARHHLEPQGQSLEFYADLEWIAGYAALRHRNDPALALGHFRRMEAVVTGAISQARAAYWVGRAEEALGLEPQAAFGRAAQVQTTFYGLLASERLGLPLDPAFAADTPLGDWRNGTVLRNDMVAAMLLLVAAERRSDAVLFGVKLGQTLPADEVSQLGALLLETGEIHLALVVSKAAAARGIMLPQIHYPLHPMAQLDLPVDAALALAIARQESEFNIAAGSGVGALGLMQLMPATAEEIAGDLGLPFERARLTRDWAYNATLGSRYLADLQEMFGATPVMIAAGYNAGPSRPRTWAGLRGDPRRGTADVIDWIEAIPFTETRNYVMRVTEAMPIYQARLSKQAGPVNFTALLNGAPPMIRPQARPVPHISVTEALEAALQAAQ